MPFILKWCVIAAAVVIIAGIVRAIWMEVEDHIQRDKEGPWSNM